MPADDELGPLARLVRAWINRPSSDYVLAAGVTAAAVGLRCAGWHPLEHLDADGRLTWLQTLTGVGLGLLALQGGAIAIVYALSPGRRLQRALGEIGHELTHRLMSCLVTMTVATVALAAAGPFYRSGKVTGVSTFLLMVGGLAGIRVARFLWLLHRILRIFAADARDAVTEPLPALVTDWTKPTIAPGDYEQLPRRRRRGAS